MTRELHLLQAGNETDGPVSNGEAENTFASRTELLLQRVKLAEEAKFDGVFFADTHAFGQRPS